MIEIVKKKNFIIAIDGPAASGKGTVARRLAKALDFVYLDTGKIYRALAQKVIDNHINSLDTEKILELIPHLEIKELESPLLKEESVGIMASKIAANPNIRKALIAFQHNIAYNPVFDDRKPAKGSVLDGRDIGSVICPDADVKLYITASLEARAQRRFMELQAFEKKLTLNQVYKDLLSRDERDKKRDCAPLIQADESKVIDTTLLSGDDVYCLAIAYIKEKIFIDEIISLDQKNCICKEVKKLMDHKGR